MEYNLKLLENESDSSRLPSLSLEERAVELGGIGNCNLYFNEECMCACVEMLMLTPFYFMNIIHLLGINLPLSIPKLEDFIKIINQEILNLGTYKGSMYINYIN